MAVHAKVWRPHSAGAGSPKGNIKRVVEGWKSNYSPKARILQDEPWPLPVFSPSSRESLGLLLCLGLEGPDEREGLGSAIRGGIGKRMAGDGVEKL
ncbi:hypothetical protein N7540_006050 [Penicillium herquei]|nr:hypothetical protein N7540_006050 [Penicillium herquei]